MIFVQNNFSFVNNYNEQTTIGNDLIFRSFATPTTNFEFRLKHLENYFSGTNKRVRSLTLKNNWQKIIQKNGYSVRKTFVLKFYFGWEFCYADFYWLIKDLILNHVLKINKTFCEWERRGLLSFYLQRVFQSNDRPCIFKSPYL